MIVLFSSLATARGNVRLPAIFSDHMVLQQNQEAPVWGWAGRGERVRVSFAGREASAVADDNGCWMTKLSVPPADGKPGALVVQGGNRIVLNDVVAGEVWLCSGQSNMRFELSGALGAKEAIAGANHPMIRLFRARMWAAAEPQKDLEGKWTVCAPDTASQFSAVGFFFGRRLHQDLNVPVGMIDSTSGGTTAEAWTRRCTLEADPTRRNQVGPASKFFEAVARYDRELTEWQKTLAEKRTPLPPAPQSPFRGAGYPASSFYNAMIAPLVPFAISGVAWYQGEARTGQYERYGHSLSSFIHDWRSAWGKDFVFLVVQLPNIKPTWDFQIVREQQLKVSQAVPRVGLVVTIDVGDANDLHPRNKKPVGERLALAAESIAYGRDVVFSGPIFDRMQVEGGKIRSRFKGSSGRLLAQGGGDLKGFAVAGADRKFVSAKAWIEGDTVIVASPAVGSSVYKCEPLVL
jgi:sialate O-acetylesterase